MKLGLHELEVTDLSADIAKPATLLFRTPEAARGYAARRGNMHGYVAYALDGRQFGIDRDDIAHAQEPVGTVVNGMPCLHLTAQPGKESL